MTEADRAFWSVVVQIVPVLLLALVVEARYLRVGRKRNRRFWTRLMQYDGEDVRALPGTIRATWWLARTMYGFWMRTVLAPMGLLVVVGALCLAEGAAMFTLAADREISETWKSLAIGAILLGTLEAAVAPVVQRVALILIHTLPPRRALAQARGMKVDR